MRKYCIQLCFLYSVVHFFIASVLFMTLNILSLFFLLFTHFLLLFFLCYSQCHMVLRTVLGTGMLLLSCHVMSGCFRPLLLYVYYSIVIALYSLTAYPISCFGFFSHCSLVPLGVQYICHLSLEYNYYLISFCLSEFRQTFTKENFPCNTVQYLHCAQMIFIVIQCHMALVAWCYYNFLVLIFVGIVVMPVYFLILYIFGLVSTAEMFPSVLFQFLLYGKQKNEMFYSQIFKCIQYTTSNKKFFQYSTCFFICAAS